jgi:hypothetical protein
MIFSEVNSVIAILERVTNAWKKRKTRTATSVPHRFVELFEAHGVHRNQIPRFFGHDVTLSDLADDTSLLKKLTEPILEAACSLFAVRREWIDGAGEYPYARHDFYKSPQNFGQFIDELKTANSNSQLSGYLIVPEDVKPEDQAALILEEVIGAVGDTAIYRYHVCDDWVFSYWKSRAFLTACVAVAWKKNVLVKGRFASRHELSTLTGTQVLPGPVLGQVVLRGRRWYAEDLALLPDQYLKGVYPEQNGFGVSSALRLWLQLEGEGWMDTGLQKEVRPAFEAELAKYGALEDS